MFKMALILLYVLALISELAKFLFELLVNFFFREKRKLQELTARQIAVVIPCFNSESVILATLQALPPQYTVFCVVNNSSDRSAAVIRDLRIRTRKDIRILEVTYEQRSKTRAVVVGTVAAQHDGFTHVLQIDDDVFWPPDVPAISVYDPSAPVTALPVLPHSTNTLIRSFQALEYVSVHLNKACQGLFGKNITWAAGAGAIYRCETLLEVLKHHDGDFIGEDVQCSYLHHHLGLRIDFVASTVLYTQAPETLKAWWRQRCHCWDISFMFYHAELLLKVLFAQIGRGPGAWIRLLTFYRLYDAVGVLVKCTLPVLLFVEPRLLLAFIVFSYVVLTIKLVFYHYLYGVRIMRGGLGLVAGFLLFPSLRIFDLDLSIGCVPQSHVSKKQDTSGAGRIW